MITIPKGVDYNLLQKSEAKVCLSRNPEDIGVRANLEDQVQLQHGTQQLKVLPTYNIVL
jgi:hypothetical protein